MFLFVVLASLGGSAQPVQARELTLAEALELAEARNETLGISQENVVQARADLHSAWLRFLPRLTVGGSGRINDRQVTRRIGEGPTAQEVIVQRQASLNGFVEGNLVLFDARTVPGILAADQAVNVAEARLTLDRYQLLYLVTEAYLSVVVAQNTVAAAQRALTTARETFRIADARVKAGVAVPIDRLRAELVVKRAEGTLIAAQATLVDAQVYLQYLLVEPELPSIAQTQVELQALPQTEVTPPSRPDLVLLEESLELDRTVAGWDWMQFLPTLNVFGRYQYTSDGGFSNQNERGWVEFGLSWDILQGGERFVQLTRNRSRVRQSELLLSRTERQADYEFRSARARVNAAKAALETAQMRVALAHEARKQVLASYEAGRAGALDLLQAEEELQNAELAMTGEQLNLVQVQVELLRASGTSPKEVL